MNSLTRYAVPFYSIMRFFVGLMFFCHGAQKNLWMVHAAGPTCEPIAAAYGSGRLDRNRGRASSLLLDYLPA